MRTINIRELIELHYQFKFKKIQENSARFKKIQENSAIALEKATDPNNDPLVSGVKDFLPLGERTFGGKKNVVE